ncbi:hypothetical protein [Hymenobacter convexus]|uniref:hypothetical protein n=1 Tax=Hymenobacter sp. CA1UV-4 TaxID=3063782 RepID=UPI0027142BC1|nr:hypothetical protein [Hymenobacter sp. CA1UV-4]MDO7851403.1 hypothetical protein [Hymenobacter sp. CA1UV-4]
MANILFRRTLTPTPTSPAAPYVALNEFWDDVKRTVYRDQETSAVDDPSEVALDTELARYAVRPGVARVVRYAGNGEIYTQDEGVTAGPGGGGVCTLDAPDITPNPAGTSYAGANDANITVVCRQGFPPYALTLRRQNDAAVLATGTSPSALFPVAFTGLSGGRYQLTVIDAAGCTRTGLFDVFEGNANGMPYGPDLRVTYSYANGLYRVFWNPRTKAVENSSIPGPYGDPNDPDYDTPTPDGTVVDGYLLADGYTWRAVYADGQGGVRFTETDTRRPGLLELHNLILFHPDTVNEPGGVLLEVNATDYPLTFQLGDGTGTTIGPAQASGSFDNLSADTYEVVVTDAVGRTLSVPFSLRVRYGKRFELVTDDVDGTPWSVSISQIAYAGDVEPLLGQGRAPVVLKTDGLNTGLGGQGDLPAVVGTSCVLQLRAELHQLEALQLGADRDFRVDVVRAGALEFRGYVTPDIYTAPLLGGKVPVSLTATDGLAALKQTGFTGHVGQVLTGRWPVLDTLLHCLSRCDVALPVCIATNRRPAEIGSLVAPERAVLTERAGYQDDKGAPLDMRQVVDACAQLLGGTLVQRSGRWEIRSVSETAGLLTHARTYRAAGTPTGTPALAGPAGLIVPPTQLAQAGHGWEWMGGGQQLSIRAGWKSLTVKTDTGYAANALPAGDAFGSDAAWNESLDALLPTAGWSDNSAAPGFPLELVRAGEKNTDLGTLWPRSTGTADARYLQSGQLPNRPEPENAPWQLKVVGRFVYPTPASGVAPPQPPVGNREAYLKADVMVDGQPPLVPLGAVFSLPTSAGAGDTTVTVALPPLPAGARVVRLRLYPWTSSAPAGTQLLIKQVALVLQPQGATWDGKDTFRADSGRGTVRPSEALSVFHADVPLKAGLFEANAFAFRRATSVVGGALTTVWARRTDLAPAPLLEATALDVLALRAAPSRLLTGPVRHRRTGPPRMLDAVDAPYDLDARRFVVGAWAWDLKAARADVSLVENGVGTVRSSLDPLAGLPDGVRLLDGVTFPVGLPVVAGQGRPRVRATHHGVRVAHK